MWTSPNSYYTMDKNGIFFPIYYVENDKVQSSNRIWQSQWLPSIYHKRIQRLNEWQQKKEKKKKKKGLKTLIHREDSCIWCLITNEPFLDSNCKHSQFLVNVFNKQQQQQKSVCLKITELFIVIEHTQDNNNWIRFNCQTESTHWNTIYHFFTFSSSFGRIIYLQNIHLHSTIE